MLNGMLLVCLCCQFGKGAISRLVSLGEFNTFLLCKQSNEWSVQENLTYVWNADISVIGQCKQDSNLNVFNMSGQFWRI